MLVLSSLLSSFIRPADFKVSSRVFPSSDSEPTVRKKMLQETVRKNGRLPSESGGGSSVGGSPVDSHIVHAFQYIRIFVEYLHG